jgi:hypothetical protein
VNENCWGSVLRTSVSLVLAFAVSVGSATAQYAPLHPPPVAAVYAYPANARVRPSQDDGTVIATLPLEYQSERNSA